MIPAGYMYKKVARRPDWLAHAPQVIDVHSISGCISERFADYTSYWRHNGYWLFNDPATMHDIAAKEGVDLRPMTLFYYEIYPEEFDEKANTWALFSADDFPTHVLPPEDKQLQGFDVATFRARASAECSPLSCNGICTQVPVNSHCLFANLAEAKTALESGLFKSAEPGPNRIFAVYTISPSTTTATSSS